MTGTTNMADNMETNLCRQGPTVCMICPTVMVEPEWSIQKGGIDLWWVWSLPLLQWFRPTLMEMSFHIAFYILRLSIILITQMWEQQWTCDTNTQEKKLIYSHSWNLASRIRLTVVSDSSCSLTTIVYFGAWLGDYIAPPVKHDIQNKNDGSIRHQIWAQSTIKL